MFLAQIGDQLKFVETVVSTEFVVLLAAGLLFISLAVLVFMWRSTGYINQQVKSTHQNTQAFMNLQIAIESNERTMTSLFERSATLREQEVLAKERQTEQLHALATVVSGVPAQVQDGLDDQQTQINLAMAKLHAQGDDLQTVLREITDLFRHMTANVKTLADNESASSAAIKRTSEDILADLRTLLTLTQSIEKQLHREEKSHGQATESDEGDDTAATADAGDGDQRVLASDGISADRSGGGAGRVAGGDRGGESDTRLDSGGGGVRAGVRNLDTADEADATE